MRRKRVSPWLILILFLVLIGVELVILFGLSDSEPAPVLTPAPTAEPFAAATPAPTPSPTPVPTATPEPSPTPTPEPTPSPTPSPSPEPTATPKPTPAGTLLASGSFRSDTGTSLNMIVKWSSYENNGQADVYLEGYLASYSLVVGYRPGGVTVNFAGTTYSFNGAEIEVAEGYAETPLFEGKITVPVGGGGDMEISYNYKGSYSDTELPTIDASGSIDAG